MNGPSLGRNTKLQLDTPRMQIFKSDAAVLEPGSAACQVDGSSGQNRSGGMHSQY